MAKGYGWGSWAFLVGVILAIVFAFITMQPWVYWVLVVIGLIIGLLNIKDKEAEKFMWAGLVLVLVSYVGQGYFVSNFAWFSNFLASMMMLFIPATIIVVLKSLFGMAK